MSESIIDFIVTRKPDDSRQYMDVLSLLPQVNVIELPFAESVAVARRRIVTVGNSPYICYFDPDDTLHLDGMQDLLERLTSQENCNGVMADGTRQARNRFIRSVPHKFKRSPADGHILKIFRRDVYQYILDNVTDDLIDWQLGAWAHRLKFIRSGLVGYTWNRWSDSQSHHFETQFSIREARRQVNQILDHKYTQVDDNYK